MSIGNCFSCIQNIAEERIREALDQGVFDDLPGKGAPLAEVDESGIPEDLRMAYHILKNANCLPPEMQQRKEIANLSEMLDKDCDERLRIEQMRKLEALIISCKTRSGRSLALHADDDAYLDKILDKIRVKRQEIAK